MDITVYSKPACKPCVSLKLWLDRKNVEYKELPLMEHLDDLIKRGFMSAPVVAINGTYMNGANLSLVAERINGNRGV